MILREFTIEDFYNWAIENHVEDYKISTQYCYDDGDYYGEDNELYCIIDKKNKKVIV